MDDERPDEGNPPPPAGDVGEEAAKLLAALQDWARATGDAGRADAAGAAAGLGAAFRHVDEHVATGEGSCTYCPVCQLIERARRTSPEVRGHLASAASSLLQAAAGMLETTVPPERPRPSGVQRIDLDGPDDPVPPTDPGGRAADPQDDGPVGWDAD